MIAINASNDFVQDTMRACQATPLRILELVPLIAHERSHEKYPHHGDDFVKEFQARLDERLSFMLNQMLAQIR